MPVRPLIHPTPEQQAAWDAFVAGHEDGHLLQTSPWAALKGHFGWSFALVESSLVERG